MKAITLYRGIRVLRIFQQHAADPATAFTEAFDPLCDLIDELAPGAVPAEQLEAGAFIRAIGAACAKAIPEIVSLKDLGEDVQAMIDSIAKLQTVIEGKEPAKPAPARVQRHKKR